MATHNPTHNPTHSPTPGLLLLGHVSGVFGVRGELRVFLHHPESDLLRTPRQVVLTSPTGEVRHVRLGIRPGPGRRIIGRVDGVEDRDAAEALVGFQIEIDAKVLPPPGDGEFYVYQLLEATVFEGDRKIGRVVDVHHADEMDVLVIETPSGREFLPCRSELIDRLDLGAGQVLLRPGVWDDAETT